MAKSRKGKIMGEHLFVQKATKLMNDKLSKLSYENRAGFYDKLHEFICSNFKGEEQELMLEAWDNVENAYEYKITLGVEKTLNEKKI